MPQLTFTRYIAALLVVFFHFGGGIGADGGAWWLVVLRQGPAMVAYFFVLSGFILATVYGVPGDGAARRRFWIARFARIYPVYLLALVVTIAVFAWFDVPIPPDAALLEATMLQAWVPGRVGMLNFPAWSLSVEAFFYALFPLLAWAMFRVRSTALVVALALALWLASWAVCEAGAQLAPKHNPAFDVLHYNPLLHLSSFVVGMAAAIALKRHEPGLAAMPRMRQAGAFALWSGAVTVIALVFVAHDWLVRTTGLALPTDRGLLAPLFAVMIVGLALDASRIANALRWAPLVALGEASYAVYILQVPLWHVYRFTLGRLIDGPVVSFLAFAALLTAASLAILVGFERPARAWLRRLGDTRAAAIAPGIVVDTAPAKFP